MGGLLGYLVGAGTRNEHSDPHLVAGDAFLMAWHGEAQLSEAGGREVAQYLDQPRTAFGVEVAGGHVWHCSLSLPAEAGLLGDEKWGRIAQGFIAKMGFDDADGSKAPARWVAVHHGQSVAGNDHIHLVVNLVREDGTKAGIHNDYARAQRACRELEAEHGLEQLDPQRAGRGQFKRAEREIAARQAAQAEFEARRRSGQETRDWSELSAKDRDGLCAQAFARVEPPRAVIARMVRGAATAACDEAEFVRRARRVGLLLRPRFASGREDVVTGYSVALRPPMAGQRPVWFGGGQIGHDLSLPRLRERWTDSPQAASAAAAEWSAARRGRRPVAPGAETRDPVPADWVRVAQEVRDLREQLRGVPADDLQTWRRVAAETAGAFASWSAQVEDSPGPLAATAQALARSADRLRLRRPSRPAGGSAAGGAVWLAAVARSGAGPVSQAIVMRELVNLAFAIHAANRAAGDARRAGVLERAVREELAGFAERLPDPPPLPDRTPVTAGAPSGPVPERAAQAARIAGQGQVPLRGVSPLPNPLTPKPRTPGVAPGAGRPPEELGR